MYHTEDNGTVDYEATGDNIMIMTIGDTKVNVDWEDNRAVEALRDMAKDGDVTIKMTMYGGFEQVGSIGQSLPRAARTSRSASPGARSLLSSVTGTNSTYMTALQPRSERL